MAQTRSALKTRPRRFESYRPLVDVLIFAAGLLGILVTAHLWIQQSRGFDQGCFGFTTSQAIEESFDCQTVVSSGAGSLFGISNVFWGLLFYLGVAGLSVAVSFSSNEALRQFKWMRAALVAVGMAYTLYLIYYQYFILEEYCALCLTSALVVTTLFVLHLIDYFQLQNHR